MKLLQTPAGVTRRLLVGSMIAIAVVALAACGGDSTTSAKETSHTPSPSSTATPQAKVQGVSSCAANGTLVSTSDTLQHALNTATPGEVIVMSPGQYAGHFILKNSGTPQAPITVCGDHSSIIDGGDQNSGYAFYVDHASYVQLEGFTVQDAQKGVVTDSMNHSLIEGLYVHDMGDEGIHLRDFSSNNTVQSNTVQDTGQESSFYGEGIYVGSANSNWCQYTSCNPDKCDNNILIGNTISDTTAENIDIKEGTTGGVLEQNHFDGTGMDPSSATAWVNVKGNDWTIKNNVGVDSPQDGLSVHQVYPGWGLDNVFEGNSGSVNASGYGIYIQSKHLGTQLSCDNSFTGAQKGLSNESCE
jgi:parallel beta-helix repeat protein